MSPTTLTRLRAHIRGLPLVTAGAVEPDAWRQLRERLQLDPGARWFSATADDDLALVVFPGQLPLGIPRGHLAPATGQEAADLIDLFDRLDGPAFDASEEWSSLGGKL